MRVRCEGLYGRDWYGWTDGPSEGILFCALVINDFLCAFVTLFGRAHLQPETSPRRRGIACRGGIEQVTMLEPS